MSRCTDCLRRVASAALIRFRRAANHAGRSRMPSPSPTSSPSHNRIRAAAVCGQAIDPPAVLRSCNHANRESDHTHDRDPRREAIHTPRGSGWRCRSGTESSISRAFASTSAIHACSIGRESTWVPYRAMRGDLSRDQPRHPAGEPDVLFLAALAAFGVNLRRTIRTGPQRGADFYDYVVATVSSADLSRSGWDPALRSRCCRPGVGCLVGVGLVPIDYSRSKTQ